MLDQFLGQIFSNQWIVFAILIVLLVGLSGFGWRVGVAHSRDKPEKTKDGGSVPAAVLTLLGLLLGFSFAMAVSRYEARRDLVVQEANFIDETARRAQLLPEPQAANVERLLREYVALRIEVHRAAQFSERFAALRKRTAELHDGLWDEAVAAAAKQPTSITATFIASLNETIDLEATRVAEKRNRVPNAVWLLLLAVAGCGLWLTSWEAGTAGRQPVLVRYVFPLLIAVVVTLITDIDNPRRGLITLDQRPLLELNESLKSHPVSE
jgi:hypothetical protein